METFHILMYVETDEINFPKASGIIIMYKYFFSMGLPGGTFINVFIGPRKMAAVTKWVIVTVMGYGNSDKTTFPRMLSLALHIYHIMQIIEIFMKSM